MSRYASAFHRLYHQQNPRKFHDLQILEMDWPLKASKREDSSAFFSRRPRTCIVSSITPEGLEARFCSKLPCEHYLQPWGWLTVTSNKQSWHRSGGRQDLQSDKERCQGGNLWPGANNSLPGHLLLEKFGVGHDSPCILAPFRPQGRLESTYCCLFMSFFSRKGGQLRILQHSSKLVGCWLAWCSFRGKYMFNLGYLAALL